MAYLSTPSRPMATLPASRALSTYANAYSAHTQERTPTMQELTQYTALVKSIAQQLLSKLPASVALDDLVQTGMLGMLDAYKRFDTTQGAQFETFANPRIRGAMLDSLRDADWAPRALRQQQKQMARSIQKLQHALGREPKDSEVAAEMGLALDELQSLRGQIGASHQLSLEGLDNEEGDSYLDRNGPVEGGSPDAVLSDARMRVALVDAMVHLAERDQQIMSMYYEHEMTLKDIAQVFGITESRVSQLHSKAVMSLRQSLRAH